LESSSPVTSGTISPNLAHSSELFHRGGGWCQPPGQFASAGLLHLPLSGLPFRS
jgi:hypothetical protein